MSDLKLWGIWYTTPTGSGWLKQGEVPETYASKRMAVSRAADRQSVADMRNIPFEYEAKPYEEARHG